MIIQKAFVMVQGDPHVGIPYSTFEMELLTEVEGGDLDALGFTRKKIADLYTDLCGDPVTVLFDFELEARHHEPEGEFDDRY